MAILQVLSTSATDGEIHENIDGHMHGPMSKFIPKYFGHFQYVHEDAVLEIRNDRGLRGRCVVPAGAPSPDSFLQWFPEYMSQQSDGARGLWHIFDCNISSEHELAGNNARLLLTISATVSTDVQKIWDHVQVVGQFCQSSYVCYQDGLLSLCRSAHEVFARQPERFFLHGFYIRGSLVELWMFDRSGLYCSDVFDIRKDFIHFLSIMLSYQRMTDHELGESNIIERENSGSYFMVDSDTAVMTSLGKLYLEDHPISSREDLVGTGTTCYRARTVNCDQWNYALKFKWRWARERSEDELLKRAKKKNVWGAVSLDFYKEVESTANLRRGLRWGKERRFAIKMHVRDKHEGNIDGFADYTEETNNFFQNRILSCVVISPVGRPLFTFQSRIELLRVFRDAIKCHRSLYQDAKILHQDISSGNIIILDDQEEGKPKGILIDLDSAVELSEGSETEPGITGTRPFMAIGVLKSECHTYRHDLESFLYVFLWTIITNRTNNLPETSKLRQWSNGDWEGLAARKSLDVEQDGFQHILKEFTPEFHSLKPLAEGLRRILFPWRDGVIWTGTDWTSAAVDKLYNEMIHEFEGAIASEVGD